MLSVAGEGRSHRGVNVPEWIGDSQEVAILPRSGAPCACSCSRSILGSELAPRIEHEAV